MLIPGSLLSCLFCSNFPGRHCLGFTTGDVRTTRGATRASQTPGDLCDHLSARLHLALHACLSARVTSLTEPSSKTQTEAVISTRI